MNYYIQDFCCICLNISNEKCSNKCSKYPDNLTPFNKIKTVFMELSAVMDSEDIICKKCSDIVDLIYEFHKTCLKNSHILSSYKNVLRENKLKKQCHLFVNLDESEQFKKDTVGKKEVKVKLPESPLNNDDTFCATDLVSEGHLNEAFGIKEEVEMNYETFDMESRTSWLDSEMKIEIEDTDLKKEWVGEIDESMQLKAEDFENNFNQSIEKAVNEEDENQESLKDVLLEVVEAKPHERQAHYEFREENPSKSFGEKPIHEEKEECDSDECGKTLSSKSVMDRHMLSHPKIQTRKRRKSHKCNVCGKLFINKRILTEHILIHTGEKPNKCNICKKLFTFKSNLRAHMLTHTGEKPHKCDICGKLFNRRFHLHRHMLTHTGEKPHKCNICEKLFTHKENFNIHISTHTNKTPHKCEICGKLFGLKARLKKHMLKHTGEKPHICERCGKSFIRKQNLDYHMLTHTGIESHKCKICEKLFKHKSTLNKHMLTHTDEKIHKCNICEKLFTHKFNLKTHMLTHTREKPFKCDICKKSFQLLQHLNYHMFTHTGEKTHKCNICEKSFTFKFHLKTHMFVHTGEKSHKCNRCEKSFTQKKSLTKHLLTHTDEKRQ